MEWYSRNLSYIWISFLFQAHFFVNPFNIGDNILKCVIYKALIEAVYTERKLSIDWKRETMFLTTCFTCITLVLSY